MIVEGIINILVKLIKLLFGWINMPTVSQDFYDAFSVIDKMLDNAQSLVDFFLPWDCVIIGLPLVIAVINFEHIYNFVMWILKKIPMLGIE